MSNNPSLVAPPARSIKADALLSPDKVSRRAIAAVILLAIGQFIVQVSLLARGVEYIASSLTIDDTYYYLQTAWNTKQVGFVTFDGLHSTNGVQFLWFVCILALTWLVKTKVALLLATMTLGFLFNGLCYLVILRIGAVLKQPSLALFLAGGWALQSLPFRIYTMGMENSLHALIFWCVIWQVSVFLLRVQRGEKPNFWGLTIVLILNAWTRLDSALLSAILYAFCVGMLAVSYRGKFNLFWQDNLKAIAGTAFFAGVGLIIQLTSFWLMGGSVLPVSALVKTSGAARGLSNAALDKLMDVYLLGLPSVIQGRFPSFVLIMLGILGILLVLRFRVARLEHPSELGAFLNLWACLLIGEIIYHVYIAVSGVQYVLYFVWYRSPTFIFWIVTGSLVALFVLEQIQRVRPAWPLINWAPIGFSLLGVLVALYLFARSLNFTSGLYVARYNAALWIEENSPLDAVYAAWNTGQLAYFSNRPFINLDGVINSVDYYERVLSGPVALTDYLSENKVDFIVDYATYGLTPDFPVVRTFPIDDGTGRSIHIWQVSPQLSSVP